MRLISWTLWSGSEHSHFSSLCLVRKVGRRVGGDGEGNDIGDEDGDRDRMGKGSGQWKGGGKMRKGNEEE